jgi:hypothetical protein
LHDLLQDVPVKRQIRHQPLKLAVLLAQLAQLTRLAQRQSRVLLLPSVKVRVADPELATEITHLRARLSLPQCTQNLLHAVFFGISGPTPSSQKTTSDAALSTYTWPTFPVLGHFIATSRLARAAQSDSTG